MRYRHLRRTVIGFLAAVAFLLLLGLALQWILHSGPVRRWTARLLEYRALAHGIDLRIEQLSWEFLPPRILLDEVSFTTVGMAGEIDHLQADLHRLRLTRRTVDLGTVVVDGLRLRVDGSSGRMPRRPTRRGGLRFTLGHLELRRVDLVGNQLFGIDHIHLHEVEGSWTTERNRPSGYLRVGRLDVQVPGLQPVTVALRTRFEIDQGIRLPRWTLSGPGLSLTGGSFLAADGGLRQHCRGEVDLEELDRVVRAGGVLSGSLSVEATVDSTEDRVVRTSVSSPLVVAAGFPVHDLRARLDLVHGRLEGRVEDGGFAGGRLRGSYALGRLAPPFPHHVQAEIEGADLATVLDLLGVPSAGLSGTAQISAGLDWSSNKIQEGSGTGTAMLSPAAGRLPVDGRLDAELQPTGLLHFAAEDLAIGGSTVHWQGPIRLGSWQPAWSIHADPVVVEEWIPAVNTWIGEPVLPPEVRGRGSVQVTLSGPWNQLRAAIRLDAQPLAFPPLELDRVVAEASIYDSAVHLGPARFALGSGSGDVEGRIGWGEKGDSPPLNLNIRARQLSLAELGRWIGINNGVHGTAAFTGGLRGQLSALHGSWALGLSEVEVAGTAIGDGSATVALEQGVFHFQGLRFDRGLEGRVLWRVGEREVAGEMHWPEISLEHLGATATRALGRSASLDLDFRWPAVGPLTGSLRARSDGLTVNAVADPSGVNLEADLGLAALATARLDRLPDGGLGGGGEIHLTAAEGLLNRLRPGAEIPVSGSGRASFEVLWPQQQWPRISGRASALDLDLDGLPAHLSRPAAFTLDQDGLAVDGVLLSVADDQLFLRFAVAADGSLSGNLSGTAEALLLRVLAPAWEPAGNATGVVEILGTVDRPTFEGIAEVSNGSFRLPDTQTVLSGINGTVLLSSGEAVLDGVDFRLLGGSGRSSGRLTMKDDTVELSLVGTASNVSYPLFSGFAPRLEGSWRLEGPVHDLHLSGDLVVRRAQLRRREDLATILLDWVEESSGPSASGPTLDLHVEADHAIESRTPFLNVVGSATVHITGTPEQLGVAGTLDFDEGGDFTFQGVRYEVERFTMTFADPGRVDPFVDLQARAWVQNYQITVRLNGTFDHLVPTVSSDPPLDEAGIYSLLALGHRNEAVGGGAMGVGLASAVLTRQINAELERRARLFLPVDQVRLDPFVESATGNPAARVTLVKQLSPKWTVILQSNLSNERQEVIVSRWYVGQGLFVEATRDIDGTLGIDLKYRRRY